MKIEQNTNTSDKIKDELDSHHYRLQKLENLFYEQYSDDEIQQNDTEELNEEPPLLTWDTLELQKEEERIN